VRITRITLALAAAGTVAAALLPGSAPALAATSTATPAQHGGPVMPVSARDDCSASYYHGNALLGPASLPTGGPVGRQLAGYRRTGGMSVARFLATYYNPAGSGSWIYPPDNGYVTGPGGKPEESTLRLYKGQDIDRYGSVYGGFLAPAALPYSARSIPPSNLDGTPAALCNYTDYQVTRSFRVDAGPIAPWFGQPGGGTQFQLNGALVKDAPAQLNVMWMIANGYLTPLPASAHRS
jgi:hypothetical protein